MKNLLLELLTFQVTWLLIDCQPDVAKSFLDRYNREVAVLHFKTTRYAFKRLSNITDYNTKVAQRHKLKYIKVVDEYRKNASAIRLDDVLDDDIKRQYKIMLFSKTSKDSYVVNNLEKVWNELTNNYFSIKIPHNSTIIKSIDFKEGTTELGIRELESVFAASDDPNELLHVWKSWREVMREGNKEGFLEYVKLNNIGAVQNGFSDAGEFKRLSYEVDNIKEIAETFWNELKPFYEEIHAYVRFKLSKVYPDHVKLDEPIPAHLLGNMWAQDWSNVFKYVKPYPGTQIISM